MKSLMTHFLPFALMTLQTALAANISAKPQVNASEAGATLEAPSAHPEHSLRLRAARSTVETANTETDGMDAVLQRKWNKGRGGCVDAEALVKVVPCGGSAVPVATLARDVQVGDCVLDGDGATQVYFRQPTSSDKVLRISLASGQSLRLTPLHLVPTPSGLMPAHALRQGQVIDAGVIEAVGPDPQEADVQLLYTISGQVLANDVKVSSYEHWTDEWLSMDARFLFRHFGATIVESSLYQTYFALESMLLDPVVHALWPMSAQTEVHA